MKRTVRGKVVLITGAAGGIGAALARACVQAGCRRLVLVDRDADGLASVRATLGASVPVVLRMVDLADAKATMALADTAPIDILVNNAGIAVAGAFATMDLVTIEQIVAVDLLAVMRLTRALLPSMPSGACIVNVASAAGLGGAPGLCAYTAAKFGVVGFSEALRSELRERGVGVLAVCPGFVRTKIMTNSAAGGQAQGFEQILEQRGMDPDRLAPRILRAIENDAARLVVGFGIRVLLGLRAVAPWLSGAILQRELRTLRRQGLLT